MSKVKRAKGGEYKSRPDNVIIKNGEYYTTGTQPPDPPPVKKDKDKDKDKDKKDGAATPAAPAAPATPAPAAPAETEKKD